MGSGDKEPTEANVKAYIFETYTVDTAALKAAMAHRVSQHEISVAKHEKSRAWHAGERIAQHFEWAER